MPPPPPCDQFNQGIQIQDLNNVHLLYRTTDPENPNKEFVLSSVDIRQDLQEDPCTYAGLTTSTPFLMKTGTTPGAYGVVWDTYFVACPHGPPCLQFYELFT